MRIICIFIMQSILSNYIFVNNANSIFLYSSIYTISSYILNDNLRNTYFYTYLNTISNYIISNNLNTS